MTFFEHITTLPQINASILVFTNISLLIIARKKKENFTMQQSLCEIRETDCFMDNVDH